MATRSGGISGAVYALVIFVFLFAISLALAVLFYSQKVEAEKLAEAEIAKRQTAVSEQQMERDYYAVYADQARQADQADEQTVVGKLRADVRDLKTLLVGDPDLPMEELERKLREQANIRPGFNATTVVRDARQEAVEARQKLEQFEAQQADLAADLQRFKTQLQEAVDARRKEVDQLEDQLADARARLKQREEQLQQQIDAGETDRAELVERHAAAVRDFESQIRALNLQINEREQRIDDLMAELTRNRMAVPDKTLEPDGKVIEVKHQDEMVFIDLGRKDKLILGMTFAVFDQDQGISVERDATGQVNHVGEKAKIEVIRFGDDGRTAACRILSQAYGEPIVEGDLISNVVYDVNRQFRFYVHGDFDMNGDGRATAGERQRVEQLIREWGGTIIEGQELPIDTDFLVLGEQMEFPEPLPEDPVPTEVEIQNWLDRKEKWERYQELQGRALRLRIPILNQNSFKSLVGWRGR